MQTDMSPLLFLKSGAGPTEDIPRGHVAASRRQTVVQRGTAVDIAWLGSAKLSVSGRRCPERLSVCRGAHEPLVTFPPSFTEQAGCAGGIQLELVRLYQLPELATERSSSLSSTYWEPPHLALCNAGMRGCCELTPDVLIRRENAPNLMATWSYQTTVFSDGNALWPGSRDYCILFGKVFVKV